MIEDIRNSFSVIKLKKKPLGSLITKKREKHNQPN